MVVLNKIYKSVLLAAIALGGCSSSVSTTDADIEHSDSLFIASFDFVNSKADTIVDNSNSLAPFYEALRRLKEAQATDIAIVPIVHYGDSHVQGGVLTQTIMRRFADDFGNAGRGMVVPHKLAGKNEPSDFSITSNSKHIGANVIEPSREMSLGVSGVSIMAAPPTQYTISTLRGDDETIDYQFSRVVVFHDSLAPIIEVANKNAVDENGGSDIFRPFITELNLLGLTDTITLRTYRENEFARGPIYGFSLENGHNGVLYHSMGVNGACFLHWGRNNVAPAQCAALEPQLIIVSLGSNEAAGYNFISSVFEREMDSFISDLKAQNPGVPILLTTPPQAMRSRKGTVVPNANFEALRNSMITYAKANNIAIFDLYGATGANGSAAHWKKNELLARDGIHYTADGYKLQGLLIYNAIKRGLLR